MRTYLLTICFCIFFYSTQPVLSADNKNNITLPEDIHSAADEILRELFDKPIEKAKEVVRQNTGIDFEKRGSDLLTSTDNKLTPELKNRLSVI